MDFYTLAAMANEAERRAKWEKAGRAKWEKTNFKTYATSLYSK